MKNNRRKVLHLFKIVLTSIQALNEHFGLGAQMLLEENEGIKNQQRPSQNCILLEQNFR